MNDSHGTSRARLLGRQKCRPSKLDKIIFQNGLCAASVRRPELLHEINAGGRGGHSKLYNKEMLTPPLMSRDYQMKSSEIRPGFYYEKQGHPGWLRLFLGIRDGYAVYVDFTGYGQCRLDNLARWASRGHTPWEATERFPEEVTRITAIRDQHPERGSRNGC